MHNHSACIARATGRPRVSGNTGSLPWPVNELAKGGFYNVDQLPVVLKDMFPEKLQTISADFYSTPGMGLHQVGEVLFPLFQGQPIRAAIKMLTHPAHGSGVGIHTLVTLAL